LQPLAEFFKSMAEPSLVVKYFGVSRK